MIIKKHRLKELLKGKECYKIDRTSHLCFEKYDDSRGEFFDLTRCLERKGRRERCVVAISGYMYPEEKYAYLDLHHVTREEWRGKGYGSAEYKKLEDVLRTKKGISMIRLSALEGADKYWRKMGYKAYRCPHDAEYYKTGGETRRRYQCRIGHPQDEGKIGGGKAKLLCGYLKDFQDKCIEHGYNCLEEIAPEAVPNKPCGRT